MLTHRDNIGYSYEMKDLYRLISDGFKKYIIYHNPCNPKQWKHSKQKGVDLILKVGKHTINLELSFCSKKYTYRTSWFIKQKYSRFRGVKDSKYNHNFVVSNRPENFNVVKDLAKFLNILIYHYTQIVIFLKRLIKTEKEGKEEIKPYNKEKRDILYRVLFINNVYRLLIESLIKEVNPLFNMTKYRKVKDG